MTAFDAPDGTVWHYVFIANAHRREETIFMVLPARRDIDTTTIYHATFRQYLNLVTGELDWFADGSPLNRRAERLG